MTSVLGQLQREGDWGGGWEASSVLALAEEGACVLHLSQPCLQAPRLSGHCHGLGRTKLVPLPPPPSVHCCKLAQILLVFSGHTANPLCFTLSAT